MRGGAPEKCSTKLEQEFESQRFSVHEYWKNFDEPAAPETQEVKVQEEVTSIMEAPVIFKDDPGEDGEEAA